MAETVALVDTFSAADQRVRAHVDLGTSGRQVGLVARASGTTATPSLYLGYLTRTNTGVVNAEIWRRSPNSTGRQVWTLLGREAAPTGAGTLEFDVIGTRLTLSLNGTKLLDVNDATGGLTGAGSAGVYLQAGSGASVDDFSAGSPTTVEPPPVNPPPVEPPVLNTFTDSFSYPNGTSPPSPWRFATGSASVSSGRLVQATMAETVALVDTFSAADQRVRAHVDLGTSGRQVGLVARASGTTATPSLYLGYLTRTNTGVVNAEIWRRSPNSTGRQVWTLLGREAAPTGAGTLEFDVIGTRLTLLLNGTKLLDVNDATGGLTGAGSAGVYLQAGSGASVDDFFVSLASTT